MHGYTVSYGSRYPCWSAVISPRHPPDFPLSSAGTEATGWAGGASPPYGAPARGIPPHIVLRYIHVGETEKIHKHIFYIRPTCFLFICFGPTKEKPTKPESPISLAIPLVCRRLLACPSPLPARLAPDAPSPVATSPTPTRRLPSPDRPALHHAHSLSPRQAGKALPPAPPLRSPSQARHSSGRRAPTGGATAGRAPSAQRAGGSAATRHLADSCDREHSHGASATTL
jgi:hypothetical protein